MYVCVCVSVCDPRGPCSMGVCQSILHVRVTAHVPHRLTRIALGVGTAGVCVCACVLALRVCAYVRMCNRVRVVYRGSDSHN